MKMRAILIEGDADAATIAAIRAVLEQATGDVRIKATASRQPVTFSDIMSQVSFETGVTSASIISPFRGKGAVRARTAVVWASCDLLRMSQQQVGDKLGFRDHTTIGAGMKRAARWLQTDPAFQALTAKLRRFVAGQSA